MMQHQHETPQSRLCVSPASCQLLAVQVPLIRHQHVTQVLHTLHVPVGDGNTRCFVTNGLGKRGRCILDCSGAVKTHVDLSQTYLERGAGTSSFGVWWGHEGPSEVQRDKHSMGAVQTMQVCAVSADVCAPALFILAPCTPMQCFVQAIRCNSALLTASLHGIRH
jgi:hypothetical protein